MNDHPTQPPLGAKPSATPQFRLATRVVSISNGYNNLRVIIESADGEEYLDLGEYVCEVHVGWNPKSQYIHPAHAYGSAPAFSDKARWVLSRLNETEPSTARAALAQEVEDGKHKSELLEQMLNVAENADETGYVTDCGFVDLDKLHAKVRASIAAQAK